MLKVLVQSSQESGLVHEFFTQLVNPFANSFANPFASQLAT